MIIPEDEIIQNVELIFKHIDTDYNGYLTYEEFVRGAIDKQIFLENKKILKFAFNFFDKDGSGLITSQELKDVLFQECNQSEDFIKKQIEQIIKDVDEDSDGRISFEEFSIMMNNILKN